MKDQNERHWEHFSDRLSEVLDDVAATHNLSPETIDILHLAVVRSYLENPVNIVERQRGTAPSSYVLH